MLFVVAFHYGVRRFDGGFIGVDVFFVISGFLISRIIYTEAVAGEFTFARFYERRIRRIVPALYVLTGAVSIVSLFYLLPGEYLDFSKSVLSVVTFCSNFLFWQESGYFAQASHGKPLLHTWSLAVEEQFYFIFPAVIYALTRFGRRREFLWIASLALASLALSIWGIRHNPEATFYLAPGRAWEFLLGSLLVVPGIPAPNGKSQQVGAVLVGLVLITAPVFLLQSTTPFPGENALAPCLGTALIIWGNTGIEGQGPRNILERVLVFFGAISYSLYLWHWPILIFYRRMLGTSPEYTRLNGYDRAALFAVAVALSYTSYRLIERPVRSRVIGVTRRSLFGGAAVASLALLSFGVAGVIGDGFPARVDPKVASIANYLTYRVDEPYQRRTCFLFPDKTFADLKPDCLRIDPGAKNVLVWGDSVAAHYVYGFRQLGPRLGLNILHASSSSCAPLFDIDRRELPNCRSFNDGVRSFIETKHPQAVVISAIWNVAMDELGYRTVLELLQQTVASITKQNVQVFLFGPPIQYIDRLPYILSQFAITGLDRFEPRKFINPKIFDLDTRMRQQFVGVAGLHYVSVLDSLCGQGKCPYLLDGSVPMQWDNHHLTKEGSVLVAAKILPVIATSLYNKP